MIYCDAKCKAIYWITKFSTTENLNKDILMFDWLPNNYSKPGDTKFKVSVTVAASTSVLFNLTYQQLLIRKGGIFENRISIQPGQVRRS